MALLPPPPPPQRLSGQVHAALAAIGAVIMFASFFVPWWSMSIDISNPEKAPPMVKKEMEQVGRLDRNEAFYMKHILLRDFWENSFFGLGPKSIHNSVMLFGWSFATGILSLIFSLLVAGAISTPLFVRQVQKWAWARALPSAALCVVILIMSFVFWLATPGGGTATILPQGVSVGPFLALGGNVGSVRRGHGRRGWTALIPV